MFSALDEDPFAGGGMYGSHIYMLSGREASNMSGIINSELYALWGCVYNMPHVLQHGAFQRPQVIANHSRFIFGIPCKSDFVGDSRLE